MTDMESLDRAVEEAREELLISTPTSAGPGPRILAGMFNAAIMRFEAAVSAKARAEERERLLSVPPCTHPKSEIYWVNDSRSICAMCGADPLEPARSSEEAGNGG